MEEIDGFPTALLAEIEIKER
jgi:hypothetical protein